MTTNNFEIMKDFPTDMGSGSPRKTVRKATPKWRKCDDTPILRQTSTTTGKAVSDHVHENTHCTEKREDPREDVRYENNQSRYKHSLQDLSICQQMVAITARRSLSLAAFNPISRWWKTNKRSIFHCELCILSVT
ncbi:hypothetical protein M513_11328 [Trichuris suis]|uniref:Uncharacterized protein n=1 Tax=Trichuris suis TaxID=68888 RepID=A0A085LS32_9BILA|nr:hypothetical protein M513_11328 [Trichuris suis]